MLTIQLIFFSFVFQEIHAFHPTHSTSKLFTIFACTLVKKGKKIFKMILVYIFWILYLFVCVLVMIDDIAATTQVK